MFYAALLANKSPLSKTRGMQRKKQGGKRAVTEMAIAAGVDATVAAQLRPAEAQAPAPKKVKSVAQLLEPYTETGPIGATTDTNHVD